MPSNHYGPIPGIPVGTMWRFRVQVPADGHRRPPALEQAAARAVGEEGLVTGASHAAGSGCRLCGRGGWASASAAARPEGATRFSVVPAGQRVGGPSTSRRRHPRPEQ